MVRIVRDINMRSSSEFSVPLCFKEGLCGSFKFCNNARKKIGKGWQKEALKTTKG